MIHRAKYRDGAWWLGLNSQVHRTSTSANATSSPVKESHLDVKLLTNGHDIFLSFVQLPSGSEATRIFARVGVSKHDLDIQTIRNIRTTHAPSKKADGQVEPQGSSEPSYYDVFDIHPPPGAIGD